MLNRHYENDSYQKLDNYLLEHCDTIVTLNSEESRLARKAAQMNKLILSID